VIVTRVPAPSSASSQVTREGASGIPMNLNVWSIRRGGSTSRIAPLMIVRDPSSVR